MELKSEAFQEHLLSQKQVSQSPISLPAEVKQVCMLHSMLVDGLFEGLLNLPVFLLREEGLRLDDQAVELLEEVLLGVNVEGLGSADGLIVEPARRMSPVHLTAAPNGTLNLPTSAHG